MKLARLFLRQRCIGSVCSVENLTGADVVAFLLKESDRLSVGSVKDEVRSALARSVRGVQFGKVLGLAPSEPIVIRRPDGTHDLVALREVGLYVVEDHVLR